MGKKRTNTRTFIVPNIGSLGPQNSNRKSNRFVPQHEFYGGNIYFYYVDDLESKKKILEKMGCSEIYEGAKVKINTLSYSLPKNYVNKKIKIVGKKGEKNIKINYKDDKGDSFSGTSDTYFLSIKEAYGVGLVLITENLEKYPLKSKEIIAAGIRKIFGYCKESRTKNFIEEITNVNWEILPIGEGERKGEKTDGDSGEHDKKNTENNTDSQFSTFLKGLNPSFIAQGKNKFSDYKVFGFSQEDIYIVDSDTYGNATYVFKGDWQELSQKTKTELMSKKLYFSRFLHGEEWFKKIKKIFEKKKSKTNIKDIKNIEELEAYFNDSDEGKTKKEKTKIVKDLLRNKKICELIKKRDKYTCTVCHEIGFEKINGGRYIEVHHLQEISRGGPDKPFNMISVCANCHRKIHFGKTL